MAKVTFKTLNQKARLFTELSIAGRYKWWEKMKNHPDLYIEIRKDNNINVYYQGGSVVRLHYCSKQKRIQAFTHPKYLGEKGKYYVNCVDILEDKFDSILENIRKHYSQKKGLSKEKWSEKYIQGNIIIKSKRDYIDSEFAYVKDGLDIRIDLVKCINGEIQFVELKRLDDGRMLKSTDDAPEVVKQVRNYKEFIEKHQNDIIEYYQKLWNIKSSLNLQVTDTCPCSVNKDPLLLIFDRWEKTSKGREEHTHRMEEILQREKVNYVITSEL